MNTITWHTPRKSKVYEYDTAKALWMGVKQFAHEHKNMPWRKDSDIYGQSGQHTQVWTAGVNTLVIEVNTR